VLEYVKIFKYNPLKTTYTKENLQGVVMDVYDRMADLYDFIYSGDFDLDFYEEEAKKAKGPILEVGCGTGRVMLELIKKGIAVDGLDISKEMLRILKNKARMMGYSPRLYHADMRDFSLKKKYSLIIVPYRSFLHLSTDEDRLASLKKMNSHLRKGGKIMLHLYVPSEDEITTANEFRPIDCDSFTIGSRKFHTFWYMKYSEKGKRADYLIELHEGDKKIKEFKMEIYFVPYAAMKKMLKKAGFEKIVAYADFSDKTFLPDEGAKEVIWVAEK